MKKFIFFRACWTQAGEEPRLLARLRSHVGGRIRVLSSTIPTEMETAKMFADAFGVDVEITEILTENLDRCPDSATTRSYIEDEGRKILKMLEALDNADTVFVVMEADYILEVSAQILDAYERRPSRRCVPFGMKRGGFGIETAMILTFTDESLGIEHLF